MSKTVAGVLDCEKTSPAVVLSLDESGHSRELLPVAVEMGDRRLTGARWQINREQGFFVFEANPMQRGTRNRRLKGWLRPWKEERALDEKEHQAKSHIEQDSSAGFVRRFRSMHAPSPQIFPGRPEFSANASTLQRHAEAPGASRSPAKPT